MTKNRVMLPIGALAITLAWLAGCGQELEEGAPEAPRPSDTAPVVSPQDPIHVCNTCNLARAANGADTFWGSTNTNPGMTMVSARLTASNGIWTQSFTVTPTPVMGTSLFVVSVNTHRCILGHCYNFDLNPTVEWTVSGGTQSQMVESVAGYGP